jgi:hypothetical protein
MGGVYLCYLFSCGNLGGLSWPSINSRMPSWSSPPPFCSSSATAASNEIARKLKIFYEALTVDRLSILGDSPPHEVRDKFVAWSQAVKHQSKWSLDGITQSVFIIARQVHDRQEKIRKNEGCATKDSSTASF